MSTDFVSTQHPRATSGKFVTAVKSAPEVALGGPGDREITVRPENGPEDAPGVGPSIVTRGAAIGYSVGESRMSREFIPEEDRPAAAAALAAAAESAEYQTADPDYWMEQFEAYDAFEAELPEGSSDAARAGHDSVTLKHLNLDLDHQPLSYNVFLVKKNEDLARNMDAPYRKSFSPERQATHDETWNARADRLTAIREQLEEINERREARHAQARSAA